MLQQDEVSNNYTIQLTDITVSDTARPTLGVYEGLPPALGLDGSRGENST